MIVLIGMGALEGVSAQGQPNLIVNGDFSQSSCYQDWCIYNTPNAVKGWIP